MPKRPLSDDFVVSDTEDTAAPASKPIKKAKANPTQSAAPSTAQQKDDNGDPYWPLNASGTRRVTLNTFHGKTMVNVREYYEKDGAMLPGKKGISLVMEQWAALVTLLPQIENVLSSMGETVPRPDFSTDGVAGVGADGVEVEQGSKMKGGKVKSGTAKPNYEDTSDEDAGTVGAASG